MSNREIDLSKPSLAGLSYLLRHKELWPKDFRWNFQFQGTCAMGLAAEYWGLNGLYSSSFMKYHFHIPENACRNIFYGHGDWAPKPHPVIARWLDLYPVKYHKVTPAMVADAIDQYLLTQVVDGSQSGLVIGSCEERTAVAA